MKTKSLEPPLKKMIAQVLNLRNQAIALEQTYHVELKKIRPPYLQSARNLIHYLAVRQQDIREIQLELQRLGLSSLGRMEANVLATLNAVLFALQRMAGSSEQLEVTLDPQLEVTLDPQLGRLLRNHTTRILGKSPRHRAVRIMVTMPEQAATDAGLIAKFLECGMDIMRINCAHDDAITWAKMLENQRQATIQLGRSCRVVFDLAGPKLRTGLFEASAEVLKIKPARSIWTSGDQSSSLFYNHKVKCANPNSLYSSNRVTIAKLPTR